MRRALIALLLVAVGVRWLWNSNAWSGPVVLRLARGHGVHANDWLAVVLWVGAYLVARPVVRFARQALDRRRMARHAPWSVERIVAAVNDS